MFTFSKFPGHLCAVVIAAAASLMSPSAFATSITYTETGIGTGALGATAFNNELVTVTGTGDTANVTSFTNSFGTFFINPLNTVTINVATVGSATLSVQGEVIDVQSTSNNFAGFATVLPSNNLLETGNSAFASYDLTTDIGPITGPGFFDLAAFATSSGTFGLLSIGDTTFTATTTPVPAALPLFATGLGGLGLLGWRRKRKARAV